MNRIRNRWRKPTPTDSFSLDQAKLAEMDLRDRLDPEQVEQAWAMSPEELHRFLREKGAQRW